jgi:hypothetical protein
VWAFPAKLAFQLMRLDVVSSAEESSGDTAPGF